MAAARQRSDGTSCRLLQCPITKHNVTVFGSADKFGCSFLDVRVVYEEDLGENLGQERLCVEKQGGLTQVDKSPTPSMEFI